MWTNKALNIRSIHFRLVAWYVSLILIISLGFCAYTYTSVSHRLYEDISERLSRRNMLIARNLFPHINRESPASFAEEIHTMYAPEANNRFIRVLNPDRSVYYLSGHPIDHQYEPADVPISTADTIPPLRLEKLGDDRTLIIIAMPVSVDGQTYYLESGALTINMETTLNNLLITLLLSIPIIVVIAASGVYIVVRYSLAPVEQIRAKAEQITFGNLRSRLPVVPTGDELESLSVTLNHMLRRLDDAYEQSMRFSADASHELRTPLTIMMTELESLVADEELPESYRQRICSLFEETERLAHITETLMTLSRLDAGDALEYCHFDLSLLVQNTAEQMNVLAEEKNIRLTIEAQNPVIVNGDPSRLKQVVINLLDNAIKYTPAEGAIALRVFVQNHNAVFEIMDNGIGIATESLPHLYKRFYRADPNNARTRGGSGLGLSIVRSICLAHSGGIDIRSIEGHGTLCTVLLPLANGDQPA